MDSEPFILLVEDSGDDARLIERALRKAQLDWPLQVVSDGDSAIEYLEGSGRFVDRATWPYPSLVLLDLKLPRRSGFEVLQYVRSQPRLRKTIIVVLTSSREPEDIARAYALGANSYLVKPIRPLEMESLMNRLQQYWLKANEPPPLAGT